MKIAKLEVLVRQQSEMTTSCFKKHAVSLGGENSCFDLRPNQLSKQQKTQFVFLCHTPSAYNSAQYPFPLSSSNCLRTS